MHYELIHKSKWPSNANVCQFTENIVKCLFYFILSVYTMYTFIVAILFVYFCKKKTHQSYFHPEIFFTFFPLSQWSRRKNKQINTHVFRNKIVIICCNAFFWISVLFSFSFSSLPHPFESLLLAFCLDLCNVCVIVVTATFGTFPVHV